MREKQEKAEFNEAAEKILDDATLTLNNGYDSFTVYNKADAKLLDLGMSVADLRYYRERLKLITGVQKK